MHRLTATSWACLAAAGMSLLALANCPYGYYMLLRWVVCGASIFAGIALVQRDRTITALLAWGLTLLFNPIIRVHFNRGTWEVLNVGAAAALVVLALMVRAQKSSAQHGGGENA